MDDTKIMGNLEAELKLLLMKYGKCVHRDQGLIIRPQATNSAERARRLKRKYKRINNQLSKYRSLPTNQQPGRPRLYRNRVGRLISVRYVDF